MEKTVFVLQDNKELANCKTAYIFKGLGRNLIPFQLNEKQLRKMKECTDEIVNDTSKIGLTLSFAQRKFVNSLSIFIANSTLMDTIQSNVYYAKKNWNNKVVAINYGNLMFKVAIKDINKLFGRSITEKPARDKPSIVEELASRKFFLISAKGEIKYQKAFPMKLEDSILKFSFHPFLIGRGYDKRKNFFDNIDTLYETIFFEYLFNKTKDFRKKPIDHLCFTTRSLLKDLGMEELAKTHKQKAIEILNICFDKAFKKGAFAQEFAYTKESFNKKDKAHINIPTNQEFKWY